MAKIKKTIQHGEVIYPLTHENAVVDNNGVSIGEKIYDLKNTKLDAKDVPTKLSDLEIDIELNGSGETIYVRPETYGAVGDGVTDDTAAFQAAIDECSTAEGAKTIFLSQKTYVIGGLNLKRYTRIIGHGWKNSFFKVLPGFSGDLLAVKEPNANFVQLKDFCILGDKANNTCQRAIVFDKANGTAGEADEPNAQDTWGLVENVRIVNMYNAGIVVKNQCRECRFYNIDVSNCNGNGVTSAASDNTFMNITSWSNGGVGFRTFSSGDRWHSCKAFGNGDSGFQISNSYGCEFVMCEAQENRKYGFWIDDMSNTSFIGIRASTNGMELKGTNTWGLGGIVFTTNCHHILVSGECDDFRKRIGEHGTQQYGLIVYGANGLTNSSIDLIVNNNEREANVDLYQLADKGNHVTINGKNYNSNMDKTFDDLDTEDKTVLGAINELNDTINSLEIEGGVISTLEHEMSDVEILDNTPEAFVRPEDFGAKGDGVTDDTEAFQAAIDACSSANGAKIIFLSQKVYVVGGLNLKRYTVLSGCGWKNSFLKVKPGFDGNLLSIVDNNANYVQLKDFCILGDKENNTCENGIYIDRQNAIGEEDENWRSADAWTLINNVRITNVYGNGIRHYYGRECRFDNLNISNCGGNGIYAQGSDNNYLNITCWCNKLSGFHVLDSNSRFVNCKSFANGDTENLSNGFYIGNTMTLTMVACEAQENFGHGFYLDNTKDSIFSGLLASTNGLINRGTTDLPYDMCGIYFNGEVQNIIMDANCNDFRRQSGEPCQKHGIEFGSVMYSTINLVVKNNENLYTTNGANSGSWVFDEGQNVININGNALTLSVLGGVRLTPSLKTGFNTLQLGGYADAARYELVGKQGDGFQLDVYNGGYNWIGCPLSVSKNGAIRLATANEALGFFGSLGEKRQTAVADATDLETAIALINNLKAILKSYGLIN